MWLSITQSKHKHVRCLFCPVACYPCNECARIDPIKTTIRSTWSPLKRRPDPILGEVASWSRLIQALSSQVEGGGVAVVGFSMFFLGNPGVNAMIAGNMSWQQKDY